MFVGTVKLPLNNETDLICDEIEKGLQDSTIIKKFLEKRAQIEEDYAKNLQKLVKSQPALSTSGGISEAFSVMLESMNQFSSHILQSVQKINIDINEPLNSFLKDFKSEQKSFISDGFNLAKERKVVFENLRMAKSNYDSIFKDPESDPNKINIAEEEYKSQINIANNYHINFHIDKLPKIQNDIQRLETIRMQRMKTNLKKYLTEFQSIPQKYTLCLKESEDSVNAIDTKHDIMNFVNFNKSINVTTPEFTFEAGEKEKKKKGWRQTMSALKIGGSFIHGVGNSSNNNASSSGGTSKEDLTSSNHPNSVFGVSMADVMEKQKAKYPTLEIPYILVLLVNLIKSYDGMKAEGIFRIPGHGNEILALKKQINEGDYNIPSDMSVHPLASLLKLWLRDMPSPLIPDSFYDRAINCESSEELVGWFKQLPTINQKIITYIVTFLHELILPENVVESKMNLDNTGMVFAPSFLRCTNTELYLTNIEKEKSFIKLLIESFQQLQECCPLQMGDIESKILSQQPSTTSNVATLPIPIVPPMDATNINNHPNLTTRLSSNSLPIFLPPPPLIQNINISPPDKLTPPYNVSSPIRPQLKNSPSSPNINFSYLNSNNSSQNSSPLNITPRGSNKDSSNNGNNTTNSNTPTPGSSSPLPPQRMSLLQVNNNHQQVQQQLYQHLSTIQPSPQSSSQNTPPPNMIKKTIKPNLPPPPTLSHHIHIHSSNFSPPSVVPQENDGGHSNNISPTLISSSANTTTTTTTTSNPTPIPPPRNKIGPTKQQSSTNLQRYPIPEFIKSQQQINSREENSQQNPPNPISKGFFK
ncbi:hypothetical protein CYY_004778 [Polysphondylium violaceum]|uniref:RhoGAP domain-containing protein n=1 Tax=Polysphondylium violaceum TaxID=133409 RepID=A0A8J4PWB7_9MYCE|nr:hypothetical protein CYY_004778 [Polysphondylium violaceum]